MFGLVTWMTLCAVPLVLKYSDVRRLRAGLGLRRLGPVEDGQRAVQPRRVRGSTGAPSSCMIGTWATIGQAQAAADLLGAAEALVGHVGEVRQAHPQEQAHGEPRQEELHQPRADPPPGPGREVIRAS